METPGKRRLRGGGSPSLGQATAVAASAKRPRRTTRSMHGVAAGAEVALPSTPPKLASRGSGRNSTSTSTSTSSHKAAVAKTILRPPPPPTVLHTGAAAAHLVARWVGKQLAAQPVPCIAGLPPPGERARMLASAALVEWLLEMQGLLLGAVGGCYRRLSRDAEEEEEDVRVGEAGLVTQMARYLLDRRDGVAQASGRAVLGFVQAACRNPYARAPPTVAGPAPHLPQHARLGPLPPVPPALAYLLGEAEAVALVCRKMGDFRPEWRCWAADVLLNTLPLGAQARLLSSTQRAMCVGMLADPNRDVRHLVAAALGSGEGKTGPLFVADAPETHVRAALELLDNAQLPMRLAGMQILSHFPPATQPALVALLPAKLTSPVRGTRLFALEALRWGLPTPLREDPDAQRACLPLVLRRLGDRAACVRRAAGAVLQSLPLPASTVERLLARAIGDGGAAAASARAAALEVVARLPLSLLEPHAAALCSLLNPTTTPTGIRKAALQAVGRLSSSALAPYIVPRLLPCLSPESEPEAQIRRAAIEALRGRDIDHVAAVLPDLVNAMATDPCDQCRAACAATLRSIDPPSEALSPFAGALLGRVVRDEVPPVRLAALKALALAPLPCLRAYVAADGQPPTAGPAPLVEVVVETGLAHEAAAMRATTLELLGRLPLDAGAGAFADAIVARVEQAREPDAAVRCLALEALLGLPAPLLSPRGIRVVAAAARGDSEARVRKAAARTLRSWGLRAGSVTSGPMAAEPAAAALVVLREKGRPAAGAGAGGKGKRKEKENADGGRGEGACTNMNTLVL